MTISTQAQKRISRLHTSIVESTVEYLDTAYLTKYAAFNAARADLVRNLSDGPMFKEPLFEVLDRYPHSSFDLKGFLTSSNGLRGDKSDVASLSDLLTKSLQLEKPYEHQIRAVTETLINKRNIAVTTGTGSGKTLAFLLPTILNIFQEGLGDASRKRWTKTIASDDRQWWSRTPLNFKAQRSSSERLPAIRSLFIYPLNALVQDQIETLRRILDSDQADQLYHNLFNGERIYFGQYNGETQGKGERTNLRRLEDCAEYLQSIVPEFADAEQKDRHRLPRPNGSELLTRWDMQDSPPDILITNYTMLAVMLVRNLEREMFEMTKQWIRSDSKNIFYLVVDELHSYRGTAGTEIAYILKTFLSRIGLSPDDPQLRIIATSASLEKSEDGDRDPSFLSDFFGTNPEKKCFEVIDGPKIDPVENSIPKIRSAAPIFQSFANTSQQNEAIQATFDNLQQLLPNMERPRTNGEVLNELGLDDALKLAVRKKTAFLNDSQISALPLKLEDIAELLFDGNKDAAIGLIDLITIEDKTLDDYVGKLRLHVFIKNLTGITQSMYMEDGKLGQEFYLYEKGTSVCPKTGAITLECCYCQECGELYYRGYKQVVEDRTVPRWFINTEKPLAKTSDDIEHIFLYFGDDDISDVRGWKRISFNGQIGEYSSSPRKGWQSGWAIELSEKIMPPKCPNCDADWSGRPDKVSSPIRTMGTGYHKLNQVIIEQLLGSLFRSSAGSSIKRPKLVVFSDSRRDASHMSAELEQNHYKDVVRALTEQFLKSPGDKGELVDFIQKCDSMEVYEIEEQPLFKISPGTANRLYALMKGSLTKEKAPDLWDLAQ